VIGAGQQQLLHVACARTLSGDRAAPDRQVACLQHVGAHPTGQRIEHRGVTRPREAAHAVDGQHRHGSRVRLDHR